MIEEAKVPQRAGEKRFGSAIQLLETERGEHMIRIAYTTDGIARRGPVTLRPRDLDRLREALGERSVLARLLGWTTAGGGA